MESSPIQEDTVEVDVYTPSDISSTKEHCQETTPEDDKKVETTLSLPRPNKVFAVDKIKSLKEKVHKLSKRKLFPGQIANAISGNESVCGTVEKRRKSDDNAQISANDGKNAGTCSLKRPLTERQQLAFLLEVTSTQSQFSSDHSHEESGKEKFTKLKARKGSKKSKKSVVNPRVYRRNERGETPLHIAAMKGDVTGITKLFKDGAEVGVKDYAGWTALHEACNHGNLAAAKVLLDRGAAVNVPGFEGDTPLHDAVMNNHVEVVDMLLSSGASPHQPNTRGKNPTDLINTKEMREVFAAHGVQLPAIPDVGNHFDGSKILADSNKGKTYMEGQHEHYNKDLITGKEFQNRIPESNEGKAMEGQGKLRNKDLILENEIQNMILESNQGKSMQGQSEQYNNDSIEAPKSNKGKTMQGQSGQYNKDLIPGKEIQNRIPESNKGNAIEGQSEQYNKDSIEVSEIQNITSKSNKDKTMQGQNGQYNKDLIVGNEIQNKIPELNKKKVMKGQSDHYNKDSIQGNEIQDKIPELSKNGRNVEVQSKHQKKCATLGKEIQDNIIESLNGKNVEVHQRELHNKGTIPGNEIRNKIQEANKNKNVERQNEHYNKGSILGNEFQRKQTQGESKMEKPVMYICKLAPGQWNEEMTVQTTQVNQVFPEKQVGVTKMPEAPELESRTESELESVVLPEAEDFTVVNKEKTSPPTEDKSGEVPGDSVEEVLGTEAPSDKDIPDPKLPQSTIAPLEREAVTPFSEENSAIGLTDSGELPSSESAQPEIQLPSRENLSFDQEKTIPHKLKKSEGEKGIEINVVEENKKEVSEAPDENDRADTPRDITFLGTSSEPRNTSLDQKVCGVHGVEKAGGDTEFTYIIGDWRAVSTNPKGFDQDSKETGSKSVVLRNEAIYANHEARRFDGLMCIESASQDDSSQIYKTRRVVPVGGQSHGRRELGSKNSKGNERVVSGRRTAVSRPRRPTITWRSLMAKGRRNLSELRVPYYDQFLINTKDYELATGADDPGLEQTVKALPLGLGNKKEELILKQERSKEELTRKQKSEEDKLQLCMEQEVVRFYAKNAYSSLKCCAPPGVCAALCWQRMAPQQLKIEKKKLSQRRPSEPSKALPTSYQEIVDKYDQLKRLMSTRHRHEHQALDTVAKGELQTA